MDVKRLNARRALGALLVVLGALFPLWASQCITANTVLPPTKVVGPFRPEMVVLPPGRFMMGSPPDEPGRDDDEVQHEVVITSSFAIARTEVTQAQWQAVMGRNPSYYQDTKDADRRPVERVSWFDAVEYLNRLTEKELGIDPCYEVSGCENVDEVATGCDASDLGCLGRYKCRQVTRIDGCTGYRLPTEAEWEFAVREGVGGATYVGALPLPDGKSTFQSKPLDAIAVYIATSSLAESKFDCRDIVRGFELKREGTGPLPCGTAVAASLQPNAWGLYDMLGNVWEWVEDDFDGRYFLERTETSTSDPSHLRRTGQIAVVRGCGFRSQPANCRAAYRDRNVHAYRIHFLGFRPARSVPLTLDPQNP